MFRIALMLKLVPFGRLHALQFQVGHKDERLNDELSL